MSSRVCGHRVHGAGEWVGVQAAPLRNGPVEIGRNVAIQRMVCAGAEGVDRIEELSRSGVVGRCAAAGPAAAAYGFPFSDLITTFRRNHAVWLIVRAL
jgi:hypothetical protein